MEQLALFPTEAEEWRRRDRAFGEAVRRVRGDDWVEWCGTARFSGDFEEEPDEELVEEFIRQLRESPTTPILEVDPSMKLWHNTSAAVVAP